MIRLLQAIEMQDVAIVFAIIVLWTARTRLPLMAERLRESIDSLPR